jgi:hypothetical protein
MIGVSKDGETRREWKGRRHRALDPPVFTLSLALPPEPREALDRGKTGIIMADQIVAISEAEALVAPKESTWRNKLGIRLTIGYLLLVAVWILWDWPEIVKLDPNEVGDMLAGVFAPLAFLWLVLGFFQQGDELRNNVQALLLQAKELNASVIHQGVIAEATQQQVEQDRERREEERQDAIRAAQPLLIVRALDDSDQLPDGMRRVYIEITNKGANCSKLLVALHPEGTIMERPVFPNEYSVTIPVVVSESESRHTVLTLSYEDRRGAAGKKIYHFLWDCQRLVILE